MSLVGTFQVQIRTVDECLQNLPESALPATSPAAELLCVGEVSALARQLPPIPASVGFESPRLSGCCAPTQVHREAIGVLTLGGNGLALPTYSKLCTFN